MSYRINWGKQRPASFWRHDLIGYLVFTAVATLVWALFGIPWWIPLYFGGNALVVFLRLIERKRDKGKLVTEVTEVEAVSVRIRQFRL
ncbi:hypothetical protein [Streptomyces sp. NPDC050485]|uniref:hypothetical protein n=1 Tax=Streptomyces sp. NPDC050485 TaxID=3365617 RepID=UPI0037B18EBB